MKKYYCIAYFLWFIGGLVGLHLLYLRRDIQAFLYWCTLGGYLGLGPLRDIVRIPHYVRDCNEPKIYLKSLATSFQKTKKPPLHLARFVAELVIGNSWCFLLMAAIPQERIFGFRLRFLLYLAPIGSAIGTWAVGNIGRQKGTLYWPLVGAFSVLPVAMIFPPALTWSCIPSALLFEWKGKEWRRTPYPKYTHRRRFLQLWLAWLLFCALWLSYFYFNAEITNNNGQKTKVRDGIKNFLNSPMYLEFKKNANTVFSTLWNEGWRKAFAILKDVLDLQGEQHSLKVLELTKGATQEEITAQYKKLTRKWHPDRHKGAEEKALAQERFVEIGSAYEKLSFIKKRRTKKSTTSDVDQLDS